MTAGQWDVQKEQSSDNLTEQHLGLQKELLLAHRWDSRWVAKSADLMVDRLADLSVQQTELRLVYLMELM